MTTHNHDDIRIEIDGDGIAVVTLDIAGQSANTMNEKYLPAMDWAMEKLRAHEGLTGVVWASAKNTFFAGGDLNKLGAMREANAEVLHYVEENKRPYRDMEKLGVPNVAAINGAALGGGYELCLACNRRIVVDDPKAVVGVPEVTLGLLPGAGGVVRLTALLGLEKALPILTEGKPHKPAAALKKGMVDEVVASRDDLIPAAKAWIKANPDQNQQPWDRKGFRYPGGDVTSPKVRMLIQGSTPFLFKKTRGLMPAPEKILDIAVNSMRMSFDKALTVESRGLCYLFTTPQCRASIATYFFGMQAIKGKKFRPAGEPWKAKTSAVLGAGMMGSGIAWSHALRGLPTVLKDTDMERVEKGRSYTASVADKWIKQGRMSEEQKAGMLDLIRGTTEDADFAGTDIIIEAVFEDIDLKDKVIPETFRQLGETGIYGSNTSTLPISELAKSCPAPDRFIGIHFFSPVDKMQLVEIIRGEQTSDETAARAYDYVQQIGKIPIIVNDSRGFFTSRVFGTFLDEGQALLVDGMNPVAIERAAWKIGMPVGPFAVHDETSQVLSKKVRDTHVALDQRLGVDSGYGAHNTATDKVAMKMVDMGRGGRHYGGGFYDYAPDGTKSLWSGLSQFMEGNGGVSMEEAEDRLLYRQAVETLRCLHEGVLRNETEANIGGIFAIGFPSHTGGAMQFIRGIGVDAFARRAAELAEAWGPRFAVDPAALDLLRESGSKAA